VSTNTELQNNATKPFYQFRANIDSPQDTNLHNNQFEDVRSRLSNVVSLLSRTNLLDITTDNLEPKELDSTITTVTQINTSGIYSVNTSTITGFPEKESSNSGTLLVIINDGATKANGLFFSNSGLIYSTIYSINDSSTTLEWQQLNFNKRVLERVKYEIALTQSSYTKCFYDLLEKTTYIGNSTNVSFSLLENAYTVGTGGNFTTINLFENNDITAQKRIHVIFDVRKETGESVKQGSGYTAYYQYNTDPNFYPLPSNGEIEKPDPITTLKLKFVNNSSEALIVNSYGFLYDENISLGLAVQPSLYEEWIAPTAVGAGTNITIPNFQIYTPNGKSLDVYVDGIRQRINDDYIEVDETTIKVLKAFDAGSEFVFKQEYGYIDTSNDNLERIIRLERSEMLNQVYNYDSFKEANYSILTVITGFEGFKYSTDSFDFNNYEIKIFLNNSSIPLVYGTDYYVDKNGDILFSMYIKKEDRLEIYAYTDDLKIRWNNSVHRELYFLYSNQPPDYFISNVNKNLASVYFKVGDSNTNGWVLLPKSEYDFVGNKIVTTNSTILGNPSEARIRIKYNTSSKQVELMRNLYKEGDLNSLIAANDADSIRDYVRYPLADMKSAIATLNTIGTGSSVPKELNLVEVEEIVDSLGEHIIDPGVDLNTMRDVSLFINGVPLKKFVEWTITGDGKAKIITAFPSVTYKLIANRYLNSSDVSFNLVEYIPTEEFQDIYYMNDFFVYEDTANDINVDVKLVVINELKEVIEKNTVINVEEFGGTYIKINSSSIDDILVEDNTGEYNYYLKVEMTGNYHKLEMAKELMNYRTELKNYTTTQIVDLINNHLEIDFSKIT
jgi:hypothetical protein